MALTDLLISSAFIILCCALAQVARKVLDRFSSINGLVKELFLEAIAAAELCSTCFELIIGKVVTEFCLCKVDNECRSNPQLLIILASQLMQYFCSCWLFGGHRYGAMQQHVLTLTWKTWLKVERLQEMLHWRHGHNLWVDVVSGDLFNSSGGWNWHKHIKAKLLKIVQQTCK